MTKMTLEQKNQDIELRHAGCGYAGIAEHLSLTKDQASGFCRRNYLTVPQASASNGNKPPDSTVRIAVKRFRRRTDINQSVSALLNAVFTGGTAISTRCREKPIMTSYARCARSPFRFMEMRIGSIAPMSATSRIGLGVAEDE